MVWFSRTSTFDPQQGYSQPDDTQPALINIAPLSVAGRLREGLFEGHTVVLTSATLAIGSAFEPAAGGLGLVGEGRPELDGRRRRVPVRLSEAGHPVRGRPPAQAGQRGVAGSARRTGGA